MAAIERDSAEAVAFSLRRSRKRSLDSGSSHDFEMSHRTTGGRMFEVREYDDGRMFVGEFQPNGRARRLDGTIGEVRGLKAAAARDPNGFLGRVRELGADEEGIVRAGAGLGVGTRYFDGLPGAAAAIAAAVAANEWYDSVDRALLRDPAFKAEMARTEAAMRTEYVASEKAADADALARGHGLFKGLRNMFGPLDKEVRDRILSYLNDPTEPGWDGIKGLCVKGHRTLWQAWCEIDPKAPRSKPGGTWERIPSAETLRAAIRAISGVEAVEEPEAGGDVVALRR